MGAWQTETRAQAEARPDPSNGSNPSNPILHLYVAADEPVVTALVERLRPRLDALGTDLAAIGTTAVDVDDVLATAPATGEGAPLAQVWIDGRASTNATIYLVPRRADRVLVRRVALSAGFDEVALAELVYILERSVTALLASQPVGAPKAEVVASLRPRPLVVIVPAEPEAPPGVSASVRPSFNLGLFVGAEAWSSEQELLPGFGLVGGLERARGAGRVGVSVDAELRAGFLANTVDGRVSVSGGAAHVLLALGRAFGNVGTGRLLLGPGLAWTDLSTAPTLAASQVVARPRTDVDWTFAVRGRWDVPLVDSFGVFVMAGFDVAPVSARYTAVVDGRTTVLLSPWPVKPTVQLGLAFGGR
jgi:hypothetical protein